MILEDSEDPGGGESLRPWVPGDEETADSHDLLPRCLSRQFRQALRQFEAKRITIFHDMME